mmetsp:Transcript_3566/g.7761  ORF Transcript_3566/g.7761 Transcript_3566/m.7761 type:complete len:119 (+) Transcript_3566:520-876(+)
MQPTPYPSTVIQGACPGMPMGPGRSLHMLQQPRHSWLRAWLLQLSRAWVLLPSRVWVLRLLRPTFSAAYHQCSFATYHSHPVLDVLLTKVSVPCSALMCKVADQDGKSKAQPPTTTRE